MITVLDDDPTGTQAMSDVSVVLDSSMIQRAIAAGVAKINVNTELRDAYLEATQATVGSTLDGSRLNVLHAAQVAAVGAVVDAKRRAFDTGGGSE